jgi:hypothetical protein
VWVSDSLSSLLLLLIRAEIRLHRWQVKILQTSFATWLVLLMAMIDAEEPVISLSTMTRPSMLPVLIQPCMDRRPFKLLEIMSSRAVTAKQLMDVH